MKKQSLFMAVLFLTTTAFAQDINDYDYGAWQAPVIKQLQAGSDNVMGYGVRNNDKWLNIAILDKTTKMLYWISCQGLVIDETKASDIAYSKLVARRLDPFIYHQTLWETALQLVDAAIYKFRHPGAVAHLRGIPDYDKAVQEEYQIARVKSAKTSLEKLAALFKERQICLFNLVRCKAAHPGKVQTDTALVRQLGSMASGQIKITGNPDSAKLATFYTTDGLSPVYKAVLNTTTSMLYFYLYNQTIFDSVPVLPKNAHKLIDERMNVFTLYQNLNEWRLAQMDSIEQELTSASTKTSRYTKNLLASYKGNKQALLSSIYAFQNKAADNLCVLNSIDQHYFEQAIRHIVTNENPSTTGQYQESDGNIFLMTMSTETRGNTEYELTDHRGNVMAVVSDKKIGHDTTGDGIIDYYTPDVVKATDYSSFGAPLPGRTFQMKAYDYGYNGKRIDNETGYLDYGNRMYDPNIARFLSVDPLTRKFPYYSPYQFAGNKPIWKRDIDGLEEEGAEEVTFWETPEQLKADEEAAEARARLMEASEEAAREKAEASMFDIPTPPPSLSDMPHPTGLDWLGSPKPFVPEPSNYVQPLNTTNAVFESANGNGVTNNSQSEEIVQPPFVAKPPLSYEDLEQTSNNFGKIAENFNINQVTTYVQDEENTYIIIGRNQDRVNDYRDALNKAGYNVESINSTYTKDQITPEVNQNWIENKLASGYNVIDIGLDPDYTKEGDYSQGAFYSGETQAVNQTQFKATVSTNVVAPSK